MARKDGGTVARREYRDGVRLSMIGFGGIAVCGHGQDEADRIVAEAIDRGVNYFDVAPSYFDGEAEIKLGQALRGRRAGVFLACKTHCRDAAGARAELERSLARAHTDHFDLYQFHGLSGVAEVRELLAPGGAAETLLRAREEGRVRWLGASCHSTEAALALMAAFPLDSVLFPLNYVCWSQGDFGPRILEAAKERGIARLALKALAHTAWAAEGEHAYPRCWYRPLDDREAARAALYFTLSQPITAAIPPGDAGLFSLALDLACEFEALDAPAQAAVLESARGIQPIFRDDTVEPIAP